MSLNKLTKKLIVLILFLGLTIDTAFANWPYQGMMGGGDLMMGAGMGWMMFLYWGMVLGILILVIRWVLNLTQRGNQSSTMPRTAFQILQERYARGEIDEAEFEFKKQILSD